MCRNKIVTSGRASLNLAAPSIQINNLFLMDDFPLIKNPGQETDTSKGITMIFNVFVNRFYGEFKKR